MNLLGFLVFGIVDADAIEDEVDDGEGEDGDDETDDGIEDGIFSVGDFFTVATGDDVAEATVDEHDDGDDAHDIENGIGDIGEDAVYAD